MAFYNSFHANDARKRTYVKDDWGDLIVGKGAANTGVYGFAFRTAEAYLNRAEANAELGHTDLALDDIEHLRKYRYEVEVPITVSLIDYPIFPIILNTTKKKSYIEAILLQLMTYYSSIVLKK